MKTATLNRLETSKEGTFGLLQSGGFSCLISELPWRNNERQKSCIPEGLYLCKWKKSPKFGWCYQVLDVPMRSSILIHAGNYVGNVDVGLRAHSYGCLLPALKLGWLDKQKAGLMSGLALRKFNSFFNREDFLLEIKNDFATRTS